MKILSGAEVADYIKERQAHQVRALVAKGITPKLIILRDNENPVINKYVALKKAYGSDIGAEVVDIVTDNLKMEIEKANNDETAHGIIVQLPLRLKDELEEILNGIEPTKDVDGLRSDDEGRKFCSATAEAINWLLGAYDIDLKKKKIAIVGQGRLVGKPLTRMWMESGYSVTGFHKGDDLMQLQDYDLIVSATGAPHLIRDEMVRAGAVIIDAGTASEGGVLVGDVAEEVRMRNDLTAITPKIGGVGPLTVTMLFEHVLQATQSV